ncbi:MAG: hypothetical protein ACXVJD_08985, partial [Mucilaginibacter sp.]
FAQQRHSIATARLRSANSKLTEFNHLAAQANVTFTFPEGFKEITAPDNEYFSFDYAIALPGKDFEIWFQVKSQKENWISYQKTKNNPNSQLANPDSTYSALGEANAAALTDDNNYFTRTIPPDVLARYNADAGKSYLLTLRDMPATKHYKYALLITLQKDHTGIIMAVCFTNEKGPEFFKNIDKARNCVKFKS